MALSQLSIKSFKGLFVQANSFSAVPDGGFEYCDNITISRDDLVTKRRGLSTFIALTETSYLPTTYTWPAPYCYHLVFFDSAPVYFTETRGEDGTFIRSRIFYGSETSTTLTAISTGSYSFQDVYRSAQASSNLYFASSNLGVGKLTGSTAAATLAGVPSGLDLEVSASSTVGIFTPDNQLAYRIFFGLTDANENRIIGAPSELTTIINSMNTGIAATETSLTVTVTHTAHGLDTLDVVVVKNADATGVDGEYSITKIDANSFSFVIGSITGTLSELDYGVYKTPSLTATLPAGLTSSHFYQVYRSSLSGSDDVSPDEDLQLVIEATLTSTDITNGYITVSDQIDDIFKGAYAMTNPNTGDGILQANEIPPLCQDLAFFSGSMFYANTESKYSVSVDLISVSSSTFAADDTISITDGTTTRTYTAKATANFASQQFKLTNSGSGVSVSVAITATAKSLCTCINRDPSGLAYAFYVSSVEDVPGKIRLVARNFNSALSVYANDATTGDNFSPALGGTSLTALAFTQDVQPHALYYSKTNEPEAVPTTNYLLIGAKNSAILRIVPLRDSLLVIKADSIHRVVGTSPSDFSSSLLDNTISCLAANSVVSLANQVYFLSNQGIVSASDTGAQVVSRPIEPLITSTFSNISSMVANAVAYESERLYILTMLDDPTSTSTYQTYVYNAVSQAWSTWDKDLQCGAVSPYTDKLYAIDVNEDQKKYLRIYKERKTYEITDYADESYAFTWKAVDGTTATIQTRLQDVDNSMLYFSSTTNWITSASSLGATTTNDSITAVPLGDQTLKITHASHGVNPGDYVIITNTKDVSDSPLITWNGTHEVQMVDGNDFYIRYSSVRTGTPATCSYGIKDSWSVGLRTNPIYTLDDSGVIYGPIESRLKTVPITGGDTSVMKLVSKFQAHFRSIGCTNALISFSCDWTNATPAVEWEADTYFTRDLIFGGWGSGLWGSGVWGSHATLASTLRTYPSAIINMLVPFASSRVTWVAVDITHKRAGEALEMQSLSFSARAYGDKTSR